MFLRKAETYALFGAKITSLFTFIEKSNGVVFMNKVNEVIKETLKSRAEREKQEAIISLRKFAEESNYVFYTVLRHVSDSGMFRRISVFASTPSEGIVCLDWFIEKLGFYKRENDFRKGEGLRVSGCGMDMGFSLVYNTASVVFGGLSKAEILRISKKTNNRRNGGFESTDTGYLIRQKWI